MPIPLSNEILLEIASYFDSLDHVRDCEVSKPSLQFKAWHEEVLNLCLVSKLFLEIFEPLLKRVLIDNGSSKRRANLILYYLEHQNEAAKVRGISLCPSALASGNLDLTISEHPALVRHLHEHGIDHHIKAAGILLTLFPNLKALQLGVQVHLRVDYQDVLNLFFYATTNQLLLPKLSSVSICYTNGREPGLDPLGIEQILLLPRIEMFNARSLFTDPPGLIRAGQVEYLPSSRTSNVTALRLRSCDVNSVFLDRIVRSIKCLEEFMFQWRSVRHVDNIIAIERLKISLGEHQISLRRITLDASFTKLFAKPGFVVLPITSFSRFEKLEYLELPAIFLTGKRRELGYSKIETDTYYQREYESRLREWISNQHWRYGTGESSGQNWQFGTEWDFLVHFLPQSTATLVLQCPNKREDVMGPAEWLQHFVMVRLHKHPNLQVIDLSTWDKPCLDALFSFSDFDMFQSIFATCGCKLKLPGSYRSASSVFDSDDHDHEQQYHEGSRTPKRLIQHGGEAVDEEYKDLFE